MAERWDVVDELGSIILRSGQLTEPVEDALGCLELSVEVGPGGP